MYMRRQCRTTTKRVGHVIQRPCTVFEANDKKLHAISFDYRRCPEYEMRQTAAGCQRLPQRTLARAPGVQNVQMSKCPASPLVRPVRLSGFGSGLSPPALSMPSSFVRFDLHRFFIIDFQLEGQKQKNEIKKGLTENAQLAIESQREEGVGEVDGDGEAVVEVVVMVMVELEGLLCPPKADDNLMKVAASIFKLTESPQKLALAKDLSQS